MIIRWLSFGRSLAKGIGHYQRGAYTEALDALNAAVKIKESDFLVQFWLLRTSVRLGRREDARRYAANCMSWRVDLAELISPWQQAANGETMSDDGLARLDAAADQLLAYHQWEDKPISLSRVAAMFGLWLGLLLLISLVYIAGEYLIFSIRPFTRVPMQHLLYIGLIFETLSILLYGKYSWRPNIRTNGWLTLRRYVAVTLSLMRNGTFIRLSIIVILFYISKAVLGSWVGEDQPPPRPFFEFPIISIFLVLATGPVQEELMFRKVLFTYLRQYSRTGAYILVALAFYLTHGLNSGLWIMVASVFFCLAYEQHNTIIASIVLHVLINTMAVIKIYFFP